jgi:lipoate-protein ligase A
MGGSEAGEVNLRFTERSEVSYVSNLPNTPFLHSIQKSCLLSTTTIMLATIRSVQASSSRLVASAPKLSTRYLSVTARRSDIEAEIDKRINPREVIERKRKEFEDKYGHKLKKKVEA